jgi:lysyl-tRNA synthetase class 2
MPVSSANDLQERLSKRHGLIRAVREFFDQRGFIEVETAVMVPSPGLELHLDAFEVVGAADSRWLSTSPEYQMKRLLAAGLPSIYQLCKCFRRDEIGDLHEPEFTMLEWYRSCAGSEEVMRDTEQLVAHLAQITYGQSAIPRRATLIDVTPPWERVTVAEAFERYAGADAMALAADEERFFRLLVDKVEPKLGQQRPTFLTEYPAPMASLARLIPGRPVVADRFEAYIDGIELCNGFGELTDPVEQRRRLERDQAARLRAGKPPYPVDEKFLRALEQGLPPSGGNALGVDRLVMLVVGAQRISDVIAIAAQEL